MKRLTVLAAAATLAVSLVATAAPAQAKDSPWLVHSGGGKGKIIRDRWMQVCDTQVDGHEVWIGYHISIFPPTDYYYWQSARPPSGGCTAVHGAVMGGIVSSFRVCITKEGCTKFLDRSQW